MADPQVTAGVDLGGTKIQTVVLRDHEVAGSARVLTPQTGAADDVIEAIAGTIRTSLEQAAVEPSALRAIGIGTPGEIDAAAGVVSLAANVPGFADRVELGPLVSKAMNGVPVTIDNDVRVGVLGEFKRGAGRPYKNLLGVWVGRDWETWEGRLKYFDYAVANHSLQQLGHRKLAVFSPVPHHQIEKAISIKVDKTRRGK
jgi:predicted NBD/HSP70 family sugar kinase